MSSLEIAGLKLAALTSAVLLRRACRQNWYNPGFNALMYAQLVSCHTSAPLARLAILSSPLDQLVEFTDTGFIQATDKIFVFTLDFWEGPQAVRRAISIV